MVRDPSDVRAIKDWDATNGKMKPKEIGDFTPKVLKLGIYEERAGWHDHRL
jgi:hypothetical protein